MGNKIITEKDFWMCSTGCVPAPFQGTASRPKTKPGDVYITERDTSTASFIDFGCSKYMWIAALAAAVVVVGAIVVGVLTVATGGAALLVFGALAGAAGAMFGGVVGGLLCGQQLGTKRKWIGTKSNFKVIGTPTITGNSTMTCAAGGSITFAPNIKNWWQAISLASANYIGEIFQGMMIGVTVGAAGMAYLGGAAAYSVGGMRAVGQAGLKFLASTPRNLAVNAIESVSKVGLIFRGIGGAQGGLQSYGETGNASAGSIAEGVFGGEMSAYRVVTGQGSWNDVWGTAMMFLPVGQGKRDVENSFRKGADDADAPVRDAETTSKPDEGETSSKADENETTRTDEPETTKSDDPENTKTEEEEGNSTRNAESESPTKPDKDGQAYEEGTSYEPRKDPRFEELAREEGKTSKGDIIKAENEAEAILSAENQGIVENPRRPNRKLGEPDLDFKIDGPDPYRWTDVKTPVNRGNLTRMAEGIGKKIPLQKAGANDVLHIVDLKNIPSSQKVGFQQSVIDAAGSSDGIVFINN